MNVDVILPRISPFVFTLFISYGKDEIYSVIGFTNEYKNTLTKNRILSSDLLDESLFLPNQFDGFNQLI